MHNFQRTRQRVLEEYHLQEQESGDIDFALRRCQLSSAHLLRYLRGPHHYGVFRWKTLCTAELTLNHQRILQI